MYPAYDTPMERFLRLNAETNERLAHLANAAVDAGLRQDALEWIERRKEES